MVEYPGIATRDAEIGSGETHSAVQAAPEVTVHAINTGEFATGIEANPG